MPRMEKAMAIAAMLSEVRGLPTNAEQLASLQRQLKSLYAAFVAMERERDDLTVLVKEASEITQIVYAGNFPAGIESFLTRAHVVTSGVPSK